jgi:hypothetical protein
MRDTDKLTGGRKPYFIDNTDGAVTTKKFYLLVVLKDTVFSALESGSTPTDEKTAMNIGTKTLPAGTIINCDGNAWFNKVTLTSGLVAGYIPMEA